MHLFSLSFSEAFTEGLLCAHIPDIMAGSPQESGRVLASGCLWFNVVEKAVVQLTPLQGRLCVTPLERFQGLWVHFQSEKWHQGAGVGSGFEEGRASEPRREIGQT